jgi:transcriptional regulator with PAS, ATPase and Fis domain
MAGPRQRDEDQRGPITGTVTLPDGGIGGAGSAVQRFHLAVVEGGETGTTWTSASDTCMLGSHPLCDLILEDATVSRFHCEIRVDASGARIRDTGSRNGTILDGVRLVEAFLRQGSLIRLGRTVVRFEYGGESNRLPLSDRAEFGLLVGTSVAMRGTFAVLEKAAAADATVLLEGETGTGKTLAARSVHQQSRRAGGPFLIVDCGAIPETLLETELFGHERGAFTGADTTRVGAFEEASGGTLFLDEIGELPPALQPKLLGVLEHRAIRRVGANTPRPVDVRLIAATNRDLRAEINAGRFRSDLYFRLAVIKIVLPSLRERPEDIAGLAERIALALGAEPARVHTLLTPALVGQLQHHAWPGNVRELKNYLERCLVFDDAVPLHATPTGVDELVVDADLSFADAKQRVIADFERVYLQKILRHHPKVAEAAAAAGIDRTYFYRLLRRHGLRA